ncbi:MAG: PIN domain-containing protein [Deltaproteobacteria bacterium]|nr:PIN domain-containing protein [Deltaproteobacteria bacterium]
MGVELLLDTGPLVALLDADQPQHTACAELFRGWRGPMLTTDAVLTEATHLLSADSRGPARCVEFVVKGGASVVHGGARRFERVLMLLRKYADGPMDYADATLVALAEELRTEHIFTLGRRGFDTFRWAGRRPFRIHP